VAWALESVGITRGVMRKYGITREKLNIVTSLMNQAVTLACGILIPHMLISTYGSEAYGISVSITQFLSYISLLEGGIGGVARAELYQPLAAGDAAGISGVYRAERRFFQHISLIFVLYSIVLGLIYPYIAHVTLFSRTYVFGLVFVIGMSTLAQYMGGLTNLTLLIADQHVYVNNIILIATTIANTAILIILTRLGCDFLIVKLGSSLVFVTRPALYAFYVRHHYRIIRKPTKTVKLKQKWTGLGQHIAYFLHTNTDVMLLTLFADAKLVAVYSVYNMIISNIRVLVEAFSGGMEAMFGELFAKKEFDKLRREYRKYLILLTSASLVLFGCAGILIVPFVRLYTSGINDVNYLQPEFALVLILAEAVNCMAFPAASLPVAANQLKQTRWGAYGEAAVNLGLSCILVQFHPLLGVVAGTLAATLFRGIYYIRYASRYILHISMSESFLYFGGSLVLLNLMIFIGRLLIGHINITNYGSWILCGGVVFLISGMVVFAIYKIADQQMREKYKNETSDH